MADDEDWRRRRAEELGLFDAVQPIGQPPRAGRLSSDAPPATRPVVDNRVAPLQPPPGAAPVAPAAPLAAGVAPRRQPPAGFTVKGPRERPRAPVARAAPPWRLLAFAATLVIAVAIGWFLRGGIAERPAAIVKAAPVAQVEPPIRLNDTDPGATAVAAPSALEAEPERFAAEPAAVEEVPPPSAATPTQAPVETAIAAVAEVRPARVRPRAEKSTERPAKRLAAATPKGRWSRPATAVALPGRAFKPSFNCRRAKATVNRMICDDRTLATLDKEMSARFYRATGGVGSEVARSIERDQVDFLNRRGRCTTTQCIDGVYRQRIAELRRES